MYETASEQAAKAKRLIELDGLIREADAEIARMATVDGPMMKASRVKARRVLVLEKAFYERGHAFNTWPSMLADMEERERKSEAEAAARAKSDATRAAEDEARRAATEAAERAKWEADNDPFILAKRAKAARTF